MFIPNLKLDDNVLPREIQRIIGNEYFFQLHLDEYNLKYGRENYIVSKILETEISHKVEGHQVIIKLKSISSIFISPKYHRIHNYSLHGITNILYILFIEFEAYTPPYLLYDFKFLYDTIKVNIVQWKNSKF